MPIDEANIPHLVVIEPAERVGLSLSLSGPQLVIGQSASADLVIDDPYISGRHALVTIDGSGRVTIRDLNSTSGTFVNGERLAGARVLEPGDRVQFADIMTRFEAGSPEPALAATQALPIVRGASAPNPPVVVGTPEPPSDGGPEAVTAGDAPVYTVRGTVFSPTLPGIGGLTVQLADKNVGGDQVLASTQTVSDGTYAFGPVTIGAAYLAEHHKRQPDLQVHVSTARGMLASSTVAYSAPPSVTLDVTLPGDATGLPSEYEILTANLAAAYPGSLSALQESNGRQDITYLANKTGWDARAVALAALAGQFSQLTARAAVSPPEPGKTQEWPVPVVSLRPEFYYALFRAGLPANPDALFRADSAGVRGVWEQATRQGIIPSALGDEIPGAVRNFQALSAARLLTTAPPAGLSTLDEMLRPVLPEAAQRESFARLCAEHQGDWSDFWTGVDQQAGTSATERLRVLGQLYCLTLNNEPVVSALLAAETEPPLRSTADLAARGYYDAARWAPLIGAAIPPSISGATADEQAANYAELLAAQVRLSFPTGTITGQIQAGIIPVAGSADTAELVAGFLTENQGTFEIGIEPVEAYLARTGTPAPPAEVIAQISRLQRVYQLTPDDASMTVLLRHNLDSAFAVTRYDAAGFTRAFAAKLGGADTAAAVHARARQIFATTLSIAAAYLGNRVNPGLGGRFPVLNVASQQSATNYPVVAYPTLENLFGSLDYCDCQDCGSILSPAAYLVDLLHYVDQPSPAGGPSDPQDILFGRRPDLQYLPLTCANTNTALPYIDLVNETLEYFVANGLSIAGYQGHDTDPAITSAELLASPQYVDDTAYAVLQNAFFPPPLPFTRPLAQLRLHMNALGVALPDAMTALRTDDELTNTSTPVSYGWSDILIERLGISRDEYRMFTDPSLQLGDLWGIPASGSPLTTLQAMSLRDFSRRLGVSYDDLALIVQTRFINPNAVLIPRLTRLNAPFTTLRTLHDTLNTPSSIEASFIQSLPAGLDATGYGGTSPTDYAAVVAWVTGPAIYPRLMDIITIAEQGETAGDCSGASLLLRYSNPDDTANQLTAADFTRLIRFVRLWQKLTPLLGDPSDAVSIQHTDDVLAALYPAAPPSPEAGFTTLLARLGFLAAVRGRLSLTGASLGQLLACWAPIGTGPGFLYQAMFLTPTLLQQDPGAQTATVGPVLNEGDILATAINNTPVSSDIVLPGDTSAQVATTIAQAINAATVPDPDTGLPVNSRFYATAAANVITIKAGFTLACSAEGSGLGTYTATAASPLLQTATVTGAPAAGDTLTTAINGVPVGYTVQTGDTPATIAAGIAALVNATTLQDPFSGFPLNGLVVSSAAANVITIIAANAGPPFSLTCGLTPAATGGYVVAPPVPAGWQATVTATTVAPGDTLITTVNQVAITYTAGPDDTDAPSLAAHIAATVSADVQVDQLTGLPVSSIVQATSKGNVIIFTAVDPASAFTLICSTGTGTETYTAGSLSPQTATATITAPIPAGATLTTTINGLPLVRTASPGDTAAMLATGIAGDITTAAAVDPNTGLPLSSVVSATAAGPVITVTGQSPTTPFTLAAALSPSQYTAGRQSPPFADDGYGDFLTDISQTLFGHQPTLCAACNLTGAEFALIAGSLGFGPATPLTLENVSALFRSGWLAHTLGLSVLEFLDLRQFTGLDPFAALDPGTTAPAEPPVIRFVRLLDACANAGLTTAQALYLMWNQDINGGSAPTTADVTGLASALRADFAAVEAQFTVQDDPDGSIAKGLMTLVYGSTASDFFFGLLNNTFSTSVPYSSPVGQPGLPAPVVAAADGQLSYNDLAKQLSYAGLLGSAAQAAIDAVITVSTTDSADNVPAGAVVTFTPASMANIYPGAGLLIDTGPAQETVIVASAAAASFTTSTLKAHDGTGMPFPIVNDPALADGIARVAAAGQQAVAPFFATYPELRPLYDAYIASTDPLPARRTALLAAFLPVLKTSRKQEQALASVTSAAGSDPSFASGLLTDAAIMHADADTAAPAVTDLTAIEQQGLSAQFFLGNDLAAPADITADSVPTLSYSPTTTVGGTTITGGDTLTTTINGIAIPYQVGAADTTLPQLAANIAAAINQATALDPGTSLPIGQLIDATASGSVITITGTDPSGAHGFFTLAVSVSPGATETYTAGSQLPAGAGGGPVAGVWSGYITVPQDGDYDISVVTGPGAAVTLEVGGVPVPGGASGSRWQNQGPVWLVAGQLTPVTLTATSLTTTLSASWQGAGLGWQLIPGQYLYSGTLVTRLSDTYTRFLKATSLAASLSLTAPELAYLATSLQTASGGSWLNDLTAAGDPDAATAASLCGVLADLLDFSRIKLALSPGDERMLAVLQDPGALLPGQQSALLSITGWSQASVAALLTRFFGSQDLASLGSVPNFRRVYDAYAVVRSCGLSAATLVSVITNVPTPGTLSALQSALRARYTTADWLTAVRPVNDAARVMQRDALVAYILQQLGDGYTTPAFTLTTTADAKEGTVTIDCGS
ncbi:MAG: FHA domain-containing protein, partial [Streptosporangiaceae bacterium]